VPYVVTEACHMCRFTECVRICPVDAFHGDDERVYIDPDACIDCGACEPQCPVKAIVDGWTAQKDPALAQWMKTNEERARSLPIITQRAAATSEAMRAKREETLIRLTGKTAAQLQEEERLLVEEQRRKEQESARRREEYARQREEYARQEQEHARQRELRAKSLKIEKEARAREFASWVPVVCRKLEVAMSEIEGATAMPARQRESLLVDLLKDLLPDVTRLEKKAGYEGFDEEDDESRSDDSVVEAYEKAHFVVRRALVDLKELGAELELEESPTECLGMEGYGVSGSTKRRLLVGKNILASWEQGIYGESQQFGTGLWVTQGKHQAGDGSFVPAASFLERNGLELSHPGFPTDHWEALEWAGVGDEDEDEDEDENENEDDQAQPTPAATDKGASLRVSRTEEREDTGDEREQGRPRKAETLPGRDGPLSTPKDEEQSGGQSRSSQVIDQENEVQPKNARGFVCDECGAFHETEEIPESEDVWVCEVEGVTTNDICEHYEEGEMECEHEMGEGWELPCGCLVTDEPKIKDFVRCLRCGVMHEAGKKSHKCS
jgi:ferredoxin